MRVRPAVLPSPSVVTDSSSHEVPANDVPRQVRVADAMVETLNELGVDTFYGVPGGAICSLYDALLDKPDMRVVNNRHETSAVFAAMGHVRVGGSLPCILVTSGPGITNAMTGVAAAFADGLPLLVIAGEVPKKNFGRGALQEGSRYHLDVLGMMRSVTKMAAEVTNPRAATNLLRKAVATALSGRQGPVFLSLPLDVANERVELSRGASHVGAAFTVDEELVSQAAAALQKSERGLILVGSGCRHPDAVGLVGALASTLNLPVATTPKAKGTFPENDPLSLGVFGHGGHVSATEYLEGGVDVLLCVGCGLGETGTNSWSPVLQPSKAFIQVDIDAAQIGRNYHVDYGIVGPAQVVLQSLLLKVRRRLVPNHAGGIRYHQPETMKEDKLPLGPPRALAMLQERFPEDTIFTADIGEHMIFALHYLQVNHPDSFIVNSGLGSMGSGIGAAVGAKLARPRRSVVSICGDFGFQMNGMELATCVQERIGVVFAVFNDARMGMVENGLHKIFGRSHPMDGPRIDFAQLARSMGAHGFTIRSAEDLANVPEEALSGNLPCVLDIQIDPKAAFSISGRVAQIKNFTN